MAWAGSGEESLASHTPDASIYLTRLAPFGAPG